MRIDGVPTEEVLRELLAEARGSGAERIVVETSHEAGDAWIRAGFTESARILEAPVELCDREPEMLRRLARELSDRMGAVVLAIGVEEGAVVRFVFLERGRVMDEYLSVPEYYGPLPPGDVIGLGANPTVIARLTGAQPARVREVARTAKSPQELPPAPELIEEIAGVLAVEGAGHGYAAAVEIPDAVAL